MYDPKEKKSSADIGDGNDNCVFLHQRFSLQGGRSCPPRHHTVVITEACSVASDAFIAFVTTLFDEIIIMFYYDWKNQGRCGTLTF